MLSINTVKVTAAPTPPAMTFAVGTLVIVYMSISFLICSADLYEREALLFEQLRIREAGNYRTETIDKV